jgi:hypothetical protein
MNRALALAAAILPFLLGLAVADEPPAPAPSPVEGPVPSPVEGFDPQDYALLPISDIQREYVMRDHPHLATRLQILGNRAQRVTGHLRERNDPQDEGSKRLLAELERLRGQFAPLTAELRRVLSGYGVEPDAFDRIRTAPKGPFREERYAHALVLAAPDVDPASRAILERLVAEVDGALVALAARGRRLERKVDGVDGETARSLREEASVDADVQGIERRFWRTVDVLLDPPARRWVRRYLPSKLTKYADVLGHLYRLSGLTTSQGSKLKALLVELDAEGAADGAAVQRADQRLKESGVPDAERKALEAEKAAAARRASDLRISTFERGMAILTPDQVAELKAIPPVVTSADRLENPKEIVERMDLTPEQVAALAALRARYEGEKRRVEAEVAKVAGLQGEYGPDSPQQENMMMAYVGIQSRVQGVIREATREIFVTILRPEQVSGWVLGLEK